MKRTLITGISGQDGAYLAQFLLKKGYEVFGAFRRSSSSHFWRLEELGVADSVRMIPMDLLEFGNILRVLEKVQPDEVYNLAAQSFVGVSFEQPLYTSEVDAMGTTRLLEAVRIVNPKIRFYQASSSEMFGKVLETPQSERTPFYPRSPYSVSKLYSHWMTVNYRESYGLHASSGILFNHESPLRGLEFVTRKITHGLARIRFNLQSCLELGNLDAKRDWGYAPDYVQGMWLMLQQKEPVDYVLATGEPRSVRDFIEEAAWVAGFQIQWEGQDENVVGTDKKSGKVIVRVNKEFYRPAEVDCLIGDSRKARENLGWSSHVKFHELVRLMMEADLRRLEK